MRKRPSRKRYSESLLSTLNSSFAYNAITIGQSCDDGWLPAVFGKKNKKDARVWILTFMYIMGMIPIFAGLSITVITNMVQLFTSCFAILNFIAYMKMPKLYPEAWKKSRFHISIREKISYHTNIPRSR